jgi:hypothetical protein
MGQTEFNLHSPTAPAFLAGDAEQHILEGAGV